MKRTIPDTLRKLQHNRKMLTINKVIDAIETLQLQEAKVTKKALMSLTNLSSATFSKDYIKDILKEYKVCQYEIKTTSNRPKGISKDIELDMRKLRDKVLRLEDIILKKDSKISSLTNELKDLESRYSLLLGKLHELNKKLEHHI